MSLEKKNSQKKSIASFFQGGQRGGSKSSAPAAAPQSPPATSEATGPRDQSRSHSQSSYEHEDENDHGNHDLSAQSAQSSADWNKHQTHGEITHIFSHRRHEMHVHSCTFTCESVHWEGYENKLELRWVQAAELEKGSEV